MFSNVRQVSVCYHRSHLTSLIDHRRVDLDRFAPLFRELGKKQHVTAQSLEKIEDGTFYSLCALGNLTSSIAIYAMVVRSSEYDLPPQMLGDIVSQSMANRIDYSTKYLGTRRDLISDHDHGDDF